MFTSFPKFLTTAFFIITSLLLLFTDAQAEAFKGGGLLSGSEKAIFFVGILIFFGLIYAVLALFIRTIRGDHREAIASSHKGLSPFVKILLIAALFMLLVLLFSS